MKFQGYCEEDGRVFREKLNVASREFQIYFKEALGLFQGDI